MNLAPAIAATLAALSLAANAAAPKTNLVDHSAAALIDAAAAKAVMAENIPARLWQVYPASKYAFVSQVEGGLTPANICVVTARVLLLPLTPATKAVLFRPSKTATAYDAVPNSGADQCKAVARAKLKEATVAVVSSLVKP